MGQRKKKAFTLAEVLITLGIIGVVAAMTIPTLVANSQKQQYVTGLKKAYTNLSQVMVQMSADYGCAGDLSCTGVFGYNSDSDQAVMNVGNAISKYFKVIQNCGNTSTACFGTKWTYYDGVPTSSTSGYLSSYYKFITADGMSFAISTYSGNVIGADCTYNLGDSPLDRSCANVDVDVNGSKPPNFLGRDVFEFHITNSGVIYPNGGQKRNPFNTWWDGATKRCVDTNKTGYFCAGRIMEEGWQMNY